MNVTTIGNLYVSDVFRFELVYARGCTCIYRLCSPDTAATHGIDLDPNDRGRAILIEECQQCRTDYHGIRLPEPLVIGVADWEAVIRLEFMSALERVEP